MDSIFLSDMQLSLVFSYSSIIQVPARKNSHRSQIHLKLVGTLVNHWVGVGTTVSDVYSWFCLLQQMRFAHEQIQSKCSNKCFLPIMNTWMQALQIFKIHFALRQQGCSLLAYYFRATMTLLGPGWKLDKSCEKRWTANKLKTFWPNVDLSHAPLDQ